MKVVLVGRGRLAGGLKRALDVEPWSVANIASTATEIPDADVVLLTVPDSAIAECAARIAGQLKPGTVVMHCAGARGLHLLDACKHAGLDVGVLHPLVSFADRTRPPSLDGKTFVAQGTTRALSAARAIATQAKARLVSAPLHGPLYHAAAAMVANGAAALAWCAVGLLEKLGTKSYDARLGIAGLLASVAENLETVGVPGALTGPIVRGDLQTVREHREILTAASPAALRAYDGIAPTIIACARAQGLKPAEAESLEQLFGVKGLE